MLIFLFYFEKSKEFFRIQNKFDPNPFQKEFLTDFEIKKYISSKKIRGSNIHWHSQSHSQWRFCLKSLNLESVWSYASSQMVKMSWIRMISPLVSVVLPQVSINAFIILKKCGIPDGGIRESCFFPRSILVFWSNDLS